MPFGTISGSTAQTFEPRQPGVYARAGLTFSDPADEFRITGASNKKDGSRAGSVTRLFQVDNTVNGATTREQAVVTLSISVPSNGSVTAAKADELAADISSFLTAETMSRLLQGEA